MQENTDKIWKFQRYGLVFEYVHGSPFSPPFNLISYLISIIKFLKEKLNKNRFSQKEEINEGKLQN